MSCRHGSIAPLAPVDPFDGGIDALACCVDPEPPDPDPPDPDEEPRSTYIADRNTFVFPGAFIADIDTGTILVQTPIFGGDGGDGGDPGDPDHPFQPNGDIRNGTRFDGGDSAGEDGPSGGDGGMVPGGGINEQ